MLRHGCFIIVCLIVILIAIPIIAAQHVPGWAVLLIVLGELALLRYGIPGLIKFGFGRFAQSLILQKSAVLRNAGVHVHRVERTTAPVNAKQMHHEQAVESDAGEATLVGGAPSDDRFVLVEFTLTPHPGKSKMHFYEPSELMLISIDTKVKYSSDANPLYSESATLSSIAQIDDSGHEHDDIDKITGPARLKAVFEIPPTMNGRVKFQYYFEAFGDFLLPADL